MLNILKIVFGGVLILITLAQPASALFNSECKKPKASYENYKNQANKFAQQANKSRIANKEKLAKDLAFCKSDFKTFIATRDKFEKALIKSKNNCGIMAVFDEYLYTPGSAESSIASKNSYQVILNNQKCFSPELVIEAQRTLKIIK